MTEETKAAVLVLGAMLALLAWAGLAFYGLACMLGATK